MDPQKVVDVSDEGLRVILVLFLLLLSFFLADVKDVADVGDLLIDFGIFHSPHGIGEVYFGQLIVERLMVRN
jgi:hypothetical protein